MKGARRTVIAQWSSGLYPYRCHYRSWRDNLCCLSSVTYRTIASTPENRYRTWRSRNRASHDGSKAEASNVVDSNKSLVERIKNFFSRKQELEVSTETKASAIAPAESFPAQAKESSTEDPSHIPSDTPKEGAPMPNTFSNPKFSRNSPSKSSNRGVTQNITPKGNQDVSSTAVNAVEAILNYKFSDRLLLCEALQSEANGQLSTEQRKAPEGNQRLALLGDKLLGFACSLVWYDSGSLRGRFDSNFQYPYVRNTTLLSQGMKSGIDRFVNSRSTHVNIATAVEAIIGAVFKDGGLSAAFKVMRQLDLLPPEQASIENGNVDNELTTERTLLGTREAKPQDRKAFHVRIDDKIEIYVQTEIERRINEFFAGLEKLDSDIDTSRSESSRTKSGDATSSRFSTSNTKQRHGKVRDPAGQVQEEKKESI